MFAAPDRFLGEKRGVHGLAYDCTFGTQNAEVAPLANNVAILRSMFVKFSADFEDSDPRKSTRYQRRKEPNTDRSPLCLGCEGDWAIVLRLVLQHTS